MRKFKSLRTFIGAKDFKTSKSFYSTLGFTETVIDQKLSVFRVEDLSFYLQDYYVEEWVNNSMILLEVDDVDQYWKFLSGLNLEATFEGVKLIPASEHVWGKECLVIDPSGVLWHFAQFY